MIIELLFIAELQCPRPRVLNWFPPRTNVLKAVKTAKRTCALDGMCLSSIREDRPNIFLAMCKKPKVPEVNQ